MKSLFQRMFLWFVGGTLCFFLTVGIAYVITNPDKIPFAWPQVGRGAIVSAGRSAVNAYESGGQPELAHYLDSLSGDTGLRSALLNANGGELGGISPPESFEGLLSRPFEQLKMNVREHAAGIRLLGRGGATYGFVAIIPRRETARFWWFALFGSLVFTGGLLCYLLARDITAPVVHLRAVTSGFSSGDLSARIAMPGVLQRQDEIGGLARDFNQMAERIETLMKAQRRLIADVSHELRSPITRLSLAVGLMRQRMDPESRAALARMQREVERLNALIAQLLMLSRLESLDRPQPMESVDLMALVREIASDADFEAASMDRSVRLTEWAPCSMYVARDLIWSAIENVVRNAVKYTEPQSQVSIRLLHTEGDGTASIVVEDRGPGVPAEALERMFEPFYRVDEARDRRSGGAGLGLAIAKQVVALHHGAVRAANREGGGLAVWIVLPVERVRPADKSLLPADISVQIRT